MSLSVEEYEYGDYFNPTNRTRNLTISEEMTEHQEIVSSIDPKQLLLDLEKLCRKQILNWHDSNNLERNNKYKLIPKGLKLEKKPIMDSTEVELLTEWDNALEECSYKFIDILIRFRNKKVQILGEQIKEIREQLNPFKGDIYYSELDKDNKTKMERFDKVIETKKLNKFYRDFNQNKKEKEQNEEMDIWQNNTPITVNGEDDVFNWLQIDSPNFSVNQQYRELNESLSNPSQQSKITKDIKRVDFKQLHHINRDDGTRDDGINRIKNNKNNYEHKGEYRRPSFRNQQHWRQQQPRGNYYQDHFNRRNFREEVYHRNQTVNTGNERTHHANYQQRREYGTNNYYYNHNPNYSRGRDYRPHYRRDDNSNWGNNRAGGLDKREHYKNPGLKERYPENKNCHFLEKSSGKIERNKESNTQIPPESPQWRTRGIKRGNEDIEGAEEGEKLGAKRKKQTLVLQTKM
ncbi:homeobox protein 2-like [Bombina bombina]|uniref:homeobox protein 2-like n=1 Tax=Bombina bombina TaxID=8345 RepID=UPI00235AE123|nr:homeobox protein 2-like [Bombina bombina]